ncbi:MAG: hypothetical protein KatS3mg081_0145 [Gemmatimonadales bacterium]|nr:MAG: hypothetical protein KatS3mg081_0145 [Gemmatimonadales bacterium]
MRLSCGAAMDNAMTGKSGGSATASETPSGGWVNLNQVARGLKDRTLAGALASLVEAVGAKDRYTQGHSLRVARYAAAIAKELGLSKVECREIALAGELHDVGKIGVPDELLHKPGALSEAERIRVLEHTLIGERILAPLLGDRPVILAAVRWHHERIDGRGYPDGLKGEEIPLAARIVAVADAFDAMRTARPYRKSLSGRMAIAELLRGSGAQFDPRCVGALLAVLRRWATRQAARSSVASKFRSRRPAIGVRCEALSWPRASVFRGPGGTGPPRGSPKMSLPAAGNCMPWHRDGRLCRSVALPARC